MRYYYDEDTRQIYLVDGMLSAIDTHDFWQWVQDNGYNVITYTEDGIDHTGAHIQRQSPYIYEYMDEFITEGCDAELLQRYIREEMPTTLILFEIT